MKAGHSPLVMAVKSVLALALAVSALPAKAGASLCRKGEQVFFNCQVAASSRLISVCGSKDLSAEQGRLQYRFGRPGKIELFYPEKPAGGQKKFLWSLYMRYRVSYAALSFSNGGFRYTVYDDFNGEDDEEGEGQSSSGVRVEKLADPDQSTSLECANADTGIFHRLGELVPAAAD